MLAGFKLSLEAPHLPGCPNSDSLGFFLILQSGLGAQGTSLEEGPSTSLGLGVPACQAEGFPLRRSSKCYSGFSLREREPPGASIERCCHSALRPGDFAKPGHYGSRPAEGPVRQTA